MARKAANGSGTIRKKIVERNGKEYVYWEARYSAGRNPGTGKPIQRSITGKTQKEVAQKLKQVLSDIEDGRIINSENATVKSWMNLWYDNYLINVSELTKQRYKSDIDLHIIPNIGAIKLSKLKTSDIQVLYATLKKKLSESSIKKIHSILHSALSQAVDNSMIKSNPADKVVLYKVPKPKLTTLEPEQVIAFINAAKLDQFGNLFIFAVFTGMRSGEIRGLTWDNVNFKKNSITIKQQLKYINSEYVLELPKEEKTRTIFPAQIAMDVLKLEEQRQNDAALYLEEIWNNYFNLVFTTEDGKPLSKQTVHSHFKKVIKNAGLPDMRFHDLRHAYAINSLQAGDDIKTIQENLGHATAAFTLDVYSASIDAMKKKSSDNMQEFYEKISAKNSAKKSG